MIRQNLHAHCTFDDGENTIEEMIAAARKEGLTSLGISIHTPVPYSSRTCPESRLQEFLDTMKALKQKYAKEGFELFAGAEWDVLSDMSYAESEERNGHAVPPLTAFDYVIGSVHAIPVKHSEKYDSPVLRRFYPDSGYTYHLVDEDIKKIKYTVRDQFAGDGNAAAERYFAEYEKITDNPAVNIVGHFDLLTKFCSQYKYYDDKDYHVFDENNPQYQAAAKKALDQLLAVHTEYIDNELADVFEALEDLRKYQLFEILARTYDHKTADAAANAALEIDKIFEVNTKHLYTLSDTGEPSFTQYPSRQWLEYILKNGGRVTVSSDAHSIAEVAKEFKTAEKILWDIGFREVWVLKATEAGNLFMPEPIENPSDKA